MKKVNIRYRLRVSDNSKNKRLIKKAMEDAGYELEVNDMVKVDFVVWDESYGIDSMMKNTIDDIVCLCGDRVYEYLKKSGVDGMGNIRLIKRPFTNREMMVVIRDMLMVMRKI
jgi:hypothetical protein